MKRISILAISLLAISLSLQAQSNDSPPPLGQVKGMKGKRPVGEESKDLNSFYKYGLFEIALPLFEDKYAKNPGDAETCFKLGVCYLETNIDKARALKFIESAQRNGYKGNDLALRFGEAYFYNEKFDDAKTKFDQYKTLEKGNVEAITEADKYISFINNAKTLMGKPLNVSFINLGDKINSIKSDYIPLVDFNETNIMYNTNQRYMTEFTEYVHDVMVSQAANGAWKKSKSIGSQINGGDQTFLGGSSPSLDVVILRPETYDNSGDLLLSDLEKKRYAIPLKLGANVNGEKSVEASGCISTSGDTLFFASDREGGFGGYDIYYSLRIGDDWGVPQNLGPNINTPYDDEYPMLSPDGRTLYFCSEGHTSMGGFDIFISKQNAQTKEWNKPQNFGYPINTLYDDYNISLSPSGRYGYVAQVNPKGVAPGFGEYDIYKVVFNKVEPNYLTYTGFVNVGPDTASQTPIMQVTQDVTLKVLKDTEVYGEYNINKKNSRYAVALEPGHFTLVIEAKGYPKYEKKITVPEAKPDVPVVMYDIFIKETAKPKDPKDKGKAGAKGAKGAKSQKK